MIPRHRLTAEPYTSPMLQSYVHFSRSKLVQLMSFRFSQKLDGRHDDILYLVLRSTPADYSAFR
jgi:hypothetical protein